MLAPAAADLLLLLLLLMFLLLLFLVLLLLRTYYCTRCCCCYYEDFYRTYDALKDYERISVLCVNVFKNSCRTKIYSFSVIWGLRLQLLFD